MTNNRSVVSLAVALALVGGLLTACDRREGADPEVAQNDTETTTGELGSATVPGVGNDDATTAMGGTDATPGMGGMSDGQVAGADGSRDPAASPGTILDNDPPAAGATQSALSQADQQFIRKAAEASMYEVAVAKLAVEKANNDRIKSMANLLLDDHRRANDRLAQIAAGRVTMPTSVPSDKQNVIDRLSKASGAEFDRQFLQTVGIRDHQADIELFERAQREVQDPALKEFVQSTLPTLKHHLSSAQDLSKTSTGARP